MCPLCCEELDLSDREFYPCKCGYQVCMWCWHRIRESESGLCPACRTPYGEDPHQFSAVDVEDVLKANKAREAALKRQKQQEGGGLSASQHEGVPNSGLSNDDGPNGAMEVPKDRSQLANMRVIRRNLVYAVGLPASIASEDILRKPEYFGQYGKISKIVINRAISGDAGRRASASAYVTFAHKEDTLACILALDGFYLDNRNIRASYGTSKYCSAFIKSVRCNNPECTYLHEMGAAEDTFTKQEIQAGYVTSGRDVLARQQQIVSEQLRQNSTGTVPRKRVGGGGPSGTGRASSSPVFPPPEYDEPPKPTPVLVPPPSGMARAATSGSLSLNPSTISAKLGRSSSVGNRSPTLGGIAGPASSNLVAPRGNKSAASVVAGVHSVKTEDSSLHTTLTPLTPLKRAPKPSKSSTSTGTHDDPKLPSIRVGKTKGNGIRNGVFSGTIGSSLANDEREPPMGPSSIGGDVIAVGSLQAPLLQGSGQLSGPNTLASAEGGLSSALGGEVFTGPLSNKPISRSTAVDKWNSNQIPGAPVYSVASDLWNGMNSGPPNGNSSSALASILGVDLPTGSGSLRENSNAWPPSTHTGPSPLSALNNNSSVGAPSGNAIGGIPMDMNSTSLIGGVPIGGGSMGGQSFMAGGSMGGSNPIGSGYSGKSDIALLQSLLPGVHITSGNEGLNTSGGWNQGGPSALGGDTLPGWNNGAAPNQRSAVGAIGQTNGSQTQRQGHIW